ncbi:MAG: Ig-like domain-containing protein [Spirochaetes bacterium]|nr:Ig-like domain-containing protein [Spirochaetota bacterium]
MLRTTMTCLTLVAISCQGFGEFWKVALDLDQSEVTLLFGAPQKLRVTSTDAGNDFSWSSSDPDKVTVAADGTVTARRTGTVIVTAKTTDERRIGQAFVTVPRGQMFTIRGGTTTQAMLYDPIAGLFKALPALTATAANGASLHPIYQGPMQGKILVIHGGATTTTSVFDPGTATFAAGPNLTSSANAGGHAFATGKGTIVCVLAGGSSMATSVYDMNSNSFSAGPNLTDNAGAGSKTFPVTSGTQNGKFITMHGNTVSTTSLFDPADSSYTTGPALPSGVAAGTNFLAVTTGASAGKTLILHGNSAATSLYNPTNNTFAATGNATTNINNGASAFLINAGTNAGKYFIIHGNSGNLTSISDSTADITGWLGGQSMPFTSGAGSHVFRVATGLYAGKLMVLYNSGTTTSLFDDASDSFSNGPQMAMGGVGLGAATLEIP